jgi:heme/copper-type cytochrome/quinol oxidase subunit 2
MGNETIQSNPVNDLPQYTPISVGEWVITIIIIAIPIVGFIMLFVWGFGSNTQPSKANWAKATLIMIGISIVLSFLFLGSLLGIMGSLMN